MLKEVYAEPLAYPEESPLHPVKRFVYSPVPAGAISGKVSPLLKGKTVVVIGGMEETASLIAEALRGQGVQVYRYAPDTSASEDAAKRFKERVGTIDGIIDLNIEYPLRFPEQRLWEPLLQQSVALLKACYEEWAQETDSQRLFYLVVTYLGGQFGHGNAPVEQPLSAMWAGMAKTLPREFPNCNIKILDCALAERAFLPARIVSELYHWGLFEVGYHEGRRYVLAQRQEDVPVESIAWGSDDVLLISGGGRGIGFAFAKDLAYTTGCRVVVTGRESLPAGDESWLLLDEEGFRSFQQRQFQIASADTTLRDIRRDLARLKRMRELYHNISEASAEGLRIEYVACDITEATQVQALVTRLRAEGLSGVMHNAGIDIPLRLNRKPWSAFLQVVRTKIQGFLALWQAVAGHELKFFANIGSLSGHYGGMIGQIDYAAANEGITHLGDWAAQTGEGRTIPFKTLCWSTWDHLGLITNYDAASKYAGVMDVQEGLLHWRREMLAPTTGEVLFIPSLGFPQPPIVAKGYAFSARTRQTKRLHSPLFYLGNVTRYQPCHFLQTRLTFERRVAPVLSDFLVDGEAAVPVSLLLECFVQTSSWIVPENAQVHLLALRDISINLTDLTLAGQQQYTIDIDVRGMWQQDEWTVEMKLRIPRAGPVGVLAQGTVIYTQEKPPFQGVPVIEGMPTSKANIAVPDRFSWRGFILKRGVWSYLSEHCLVSLATQDYAADLWSLPSPLENFLPWSGIEQSLRISLALDTSSRLANWLVIPHIRLFRTREQSRYVLGDVRQNIWTLPLAKQQGLCLLERPSYAWFKCP